MIQDEHDDNEEDAYDIFMCITLASAKTLADFSKVYNLSVATAIVTIDL